VDALASAFEEFAQLHERLDQPAEGLLRSAYSLDRAPRITLIYYSRTGVTNGDESS